MVDTSGLLREYSSAELHNWNDGIVKYWDNGFRRTGFIGKWIPNSFSSVI